MNPPRNLLLDFMIHLFLAIALLAMLAVGIVLMLGFTIVDGIVRTVARWRKQNGGTHRAQL